MWQISKFLSSFDPFKEQKEASYLSYTTSISSLAKYILLTTSAADLTVANNRHHLEHVVLVSRMTMQYIHNASPSLLLSVFLESHHNT